VEKEMTEIKKAQAFLAYWQRQLRLDHWDVELRLGAPDEMTDGASAQSATRRYNGAVIVVRPEQETVPALQRFLRNDLEVRIVHELLHIKESLWRNNPKLNVMDEDRWINRLHEECLDAIAEALVRARRGMERQGIGSREQKAVTR
jgi:hypothetical protein